MTGSRKIKLGWLFPYSGIFKSLKNDLQQGFNTALEKEGANFMVETYAEFVQTGSLPDTEKALKKLLLYERVDLVIGVCSTKVAINIQPLLQTSRIPLILLNLGADIPPPELQAEYLFYNSLHLWKSEWAIGKWAQEKYGGEPSINLSAYEGGYGLSAAFKAGVATGGATSMKLNMVRNFSTNPDTSPLIQYLKDQRPRHTHALMSDKEGQQFLQLFHDQDLRSDTQLTVNPFMAEDGILSQIPGDLALYNAMTWSASLENECNLVFMHLYQKNGGNPPNAFSLLAYEAGLALSAAVRDIPGAISSEALVRTLGQVHPRGPRGAVTLSIHPLQTDQTIYLRLPVRSSLTGRPENKILETLTGIEWNDPSLSEGNNYLSGWQNPYLCV